MAWNALYVSDLGAVAPFYQALFNWTLAADDRDADLSHVIIHGAARSVVSDHGTIVYDGTDTLVARDGTARRSSSCRGHVDGGVSLIKS